MGVHVADPPADSAFPFAGWSDGLECNAQVQEEVRHLTALQAHLSLGLDAPQ